MKKVFLLAASALMVTGLALADDGGKKCKKKCKDKGAACCKKDGAEKKSCCSKKEKTATL